MNPTRRDTPFREAMRSLLVFDGAMGSLLYERGVFVTQNFEQLNVTRPDVVRKIHEDYVAAGAQVIETNTFGANRFCLERHGLVDQVRAYNLAGARARARGRPARTSTSAGSIGPDRARARASASWAELDLAAATFAEQAAALVEGGVDLLVLETFRHLEEIQIAIDGGRAAAAPGLPILASMTFDPSGTVADGSAPEKVAERPARLGADAIGVNYGDGPQLALAMAERMRGADLPLCVQPNAGLPRTVDGRQLYMATPEYFDVFARRMIQAGAHMIGGCCGTTPEHVRWMAKSGAHARRRRAERGRPSARAGATEVAPVGVAPTPLAERSAFAAKLAAGKFVVSVEVNPAPGLDPTPALEASKMLLDSGVDIVNVADGAARHGAHVEPRVLLAAARATTGSSRILHVCGRDRNLLAPDGAPARRARHRHPQPRHHHRRSAQGRRLPRGHRGLRPRLHRPAADGVEHEPRRRSRGQAAAPAARRRSCSRPASSPARADLDKEIRRLEQKKRRRRRVRDDPAGLPDRTCSRRFFDRIAHLGMPVLVGVLPLVSYKNAEFLHNEVPGMQIPEAIRERMRKATPGAEARARRASASRARCSSRCATACRART